MIPIRCFVILMLVHWLADFALQTPEQANNKYTDFTALASHVLAYSASMAIAIVGLYYGAVSAWFLPVAILLISLSHLFIDLLTSKETHSLYEQKRYHDFFVVIGFDQLLHMLTILAICCIGGKA